MKISIIVAMASNSVIGVNNQIPWHLSADLKRFKKTTMGSSIVMGRKTFESIGKALPGRTNIVISHNVDYRAEGCIVANGIEAGIKVACRHSDNAFIIGGSALYKLGLPLAETLYITQIHKEFTGDTVFPKVDEAEWLETEREDIDNDPDAGFRYSFLKWEKIAQ